MEENKRRKVVILSLSGLLIGSLLFLFGISINSSIIPLICQYFIAILLYISSFLSVFNNYKTDHQNIYRYIMLLTIFLIIFITIALLNNLLG